MARPGSSIRMSVNIVGMNEVIGRLNKLDVASRVAVRSEVTKSANRIRKAARQRVPINTKKLQQSIRARYSTDKLSAEIGPTIFYAHFVEFGTVDTPAKPFMHPSWEEERPKYMDAIKKAMRGAMR